VRIPDTVALEATPPDQPPAARTDIVVGIATAPSEPFGQEVAAQVAEGLREAFPTRRSSVVLLVPRGGHCEVQAPPAVPTEAPPGGQQEATAALEQPSPIAGGFSGTKSALPALLLEAQRIGAPLCALISAERHDASADGLRLLIAPILEDGYDFVCPAYRRRKLDGALTKGVAYPLTRALFGRRLRQPLGGELALSRKLADALLEDDAWRNEPAHAGADVWLVAMALSSEYRLCQSFLGAAPERESDRPADLSDAVARLMGLLFREVERHASAWQRVFGSVPVPTFGASGVLEDEAQPVNVGRLVDAFALGLRQLREVWRLVLPPATLFQLTRLPLEPATAFNLPDELWARVIYDFALGYRMRLLDRVQMLRSMTPLYLGWLASFVNEVRDLDGPGTEERVERLCQAFEGNKTYLIARWRWPDRFAP
jgi:hypothetical protein